MAETESERGAVLSLRASQIAGFQSFFGNLELFAESFNGILRSKPGGRDAKSQRQTNFLEGNEGEVNFGEKRHNLLCLLAGRGAGGRGGQRVLGSGARNLWGGGEGGGGGVLQGCGGCGGRPGFHAVRFC